MALTAKDKERLSPENEKLAQRWRAEGRRYANKVEPNHFKEGTLAAFCFAMGKAQDVRSPCELIRDYYKIKG